MRHQAAMSCTAAALLTVTCNVAPGGSARTRLLSSTARWPQPMSPAFQVAFDWSLIVLRVWYIAVMVVRIDACDVRFQHDLQEMQ